MKTSTAKGAAYRRLNKLKKTFSLSQDAIAFLETIGKQERKSSSQVLEEVIHARKRAAERKRISESIRRYYDSLSLDEQAEQRAWGKFSESQFPGE